LRANVSIMEPSVIGYVGLPRCLGHRNIQRAVRYTKLALSVFDGFLRD
jgi:hypothetical protein